jgi:hypothetical protein
MRDKFIFVCGWVTAIACMIVVFFGFIVLFSGCTYSVVMSHASGGSTDDITETQSPTNTVSPDIQIPLVGK